MKTVRWGIVQALGLSILAVGATLAPTSTTAQVTSATVRGRVMSQGQPVSAGLQVVATNSQTGFTKQAITQDDGAYALIGLAPGTYQLKISGPGYQETARAVRVQIGQTIDLDLQAMRAAEPVSDEIVVNAERLVDMRTSEVATNVSLEQIESLPQGNRNFLNFAALAPGVRINDRDTEKTFQAGALGANAVNVYIDGVSYKNQVINGGIIGQEASRGNPFPQNAVQEFRVITQNSGRRRASPTDWMRGQPSTSAGVPATSANRRRARRGRRARSARRSSSSAPTTRLPSVHRPGPTTRPPRAVPTARPLARPQRRAGCGFLPPWATAQRRWRECPAAWGPYWARASNARACAASAKSGLIVSDRSSDRFASTLLPLSRYASPRR
jgi:hypothetical protein